MKLRVLDIARAARSKAKPGRAKLNRAYGQLLSSTSRVGGQAKRFAAEIVGAVKGASDVRKQRVPASLRQEIEAMVPLVRQLMKQTRARIFRGDTSMIAALSSAVASMRRIAFGFLHFRLFVEIDQQGEQLVWYRLRQLAIIHCPQGSADPRADGPVIER